MRVLRTLLAVSAVVVLAAACTSGGGGGESTDTASPAQTLSAGDGAEVAALDLVGNWGLDSASVGGSDVALIAEAPVTLEVAEDLQVSGQSACNRYMGSVAVEGTSVTFGQLASTLMACEEAVMAVETAYLTALGAVDEGARSGDSLTLTGEGVELAFTLQGAAG